MENKKTTELIDLLHKLVGEDGKLQEGYDEAFEELKTREPFFSILSEDWDESVPALHERIKDLEEEVKRLKRHKHDVNSGYVMIRV